jgi:alpha-N-acetylglucosaminidase
MGNIQKYGGPLSAHWLQQQETLGQQIVERATDLGMLPAVPAFAGHVPVALKT